MDQTQASRWRCSRALLRALPFVVAALFAHPPAARAQGRPDIVWMRGTVGDFWQGMSMSADRRALAMVCDFGERAKVWRTSDGMLQCTATVSGTQNSGVALSHDGETLVGAGYDGVLRLWRVADGELIRTIAGPTGQSLWPACSPVTDTVAAVFADDTIKLHRMSDGALVGAIALPDFVWRLAFAPDGSMLAAACADKTVWVWRVSDGALVRRLAGHTGKVTCVCFSSDGSTLASGSDDGTIRRWRVADGSQIGFIGGLGGVASVDLPPLGSLMAAVCKGYLKVWDLVDGSLKCSTVGGGDTGAAFTADGLSVVGGLYDPYRICQWRASDGALEAVLACAAERRAAVSPDSSLVAAVAETEIRLYEAHGGAPVSTIALRGYSSADGVDFAPDSASVACKQGFELARWRVSDGALLNTTTFAVSDVYEVAYSPEGAHVAVGGRSVQLVRSSDWQPVRTLTPPRGASSQCMAWSPDGATIVTGVVNGTLVFWRAGDGAILRTVAAHNGFVDAVAYSPDGTAVASGGSDNAVRLWNPVDGGLLRSLSGHTQRVLSVAFSPDASTLASAGNDGTLRIWRVSDGALLRTYDRECPSYVHRIRYTNDGRLIIWWRADSVIVAARNPYGPLDTLLAVADAAAAVGDTVMLAATLTCDGAPVSGKLVTFTAGAEVISAVTDAAGTATAGLHVTDALPPGPVAVMATFSGDLSYAESSGTGTLTVGAAPTTLYTIDRTGTITENVIMRQYDLRRTTDNALLADKPVTFRIDGTEVGTATTNAGGDSSLVWAVPAGPPSRTVTVEFAGDTAYNPSSANATLTALTWATKMATFDRTARITARTELKCRLLRSDDAPLPSKSIHFSVDGTFVITRPTDVQGYARYAYYDVPDGAGAGSRTILSSWTGNGGYLASSKTATLTVLPALPYMWVLPKTVPLGSKVSLYAYFRRLSDYQKQAGKPVTFLVDGTAVQTVTTDANGVALYLYQTVEAIGDHTVRCEFAGDAWVEAGYGEGLLRVY